MKNKKYFIVLFLFIIIYVFSTKVSASTPKIVNKMDDAFSDIQSWILKLSTPAAAVAVGVGLFMKKFSFGDEERIRSAKKMIRGSLVAYALVLGIDLILQAIKTLVS